MKEPTNRGWRVSLIKAEALGLIQRALGAYSENGYNCSMQLRR
jgi:hypothetical protein